MIVIFFFKRKLSLWLSLLYSYQIHFIVTHIYRFDKFDFLKKTNLILMFLVLL